MEDSLSRRFSDSRAVPPCSGPLMRMSPERRGKSSTRLVIPGLISSVLSTVSLGIRPYKVSERRRFIFAGMERLMVSPAKSAV